jgi:hypothetical protein
VLVISTTSNNARYDHSVITEKVFISVSVTWFVHVRDCVVVVVAADQFDTYVESSRVSWVR